MPAAVLSAPGAGSYALSFQGFRLGLSCRSRYFLPSVITTYGSMGSCLQGGKAARWLSCMSCKKHVSQELLLHTQVRTASRTRCAARQASFSAAQP